MVVMTRCVLCGTENSDDVAICRHHTVGDQQWATVNRLFCDLLHRGIRPVYPSTPDEVEPWIIVEADVESEAMAVA